MQLFRPIEEKDLAGLMALARATGGGLTTLPADEEFLAERIQETLRAFSSRVSSPGAQVYLFVLEDLGTGEIVGTSGLAARVGGFDPWYSYEICRERFVHRPLQVEKDIAVLHLKKEHRGPSETCSLFLRTDRRHSGSGRLLSLARFQFVGAFPKRFTPTVIAEMRGYIDQNGKSPFWEAVGRHFFDHEFYQADFISGHGDKEFIAGLMPRHPLYVPLLPADVQAVLGRVHHETEAALSLLLSEGFETTNEIDIFDGGPHLRALVPEIRTIRESRTATVRDVRPGAPAGAPTHLLSNGRIGFRACLGTVLERREGVLIAEDIAAALQLAPGDALTYSPMRSNPK